MSRPGRTLSRVRTSSAFSAAPPMEWNRSSSVSHFSCGEFHVKLARGTPATAVRGQRPVPGAALLAAPPARSRLPPPGRGYSFDGHLRARLAPDANRGRGRSVTIAQEERSAELRSCRPARRSRPKGEDRPHFRAPPTEHPRHSTPSSRARLGDHGRRSPRHTPYPARVPARPAHSMRLTRRRDLPRDTRPGVVPAAPVAPSRRAATRAPPIPAPPSGLNQRHPPIPDAARQRTRPVREPCPRVDVPAKELTHRELSPAPAPQHTRHRRHARDGEGASSSRAERRRLRSALRFLVPLYHYCDRVPLNPVLSRPELSRVEKHRG